MLTRYLTVAAGAVVVVAAGCWPHTAEGAEVRGGGEGGVAAVAVAAAPVAVWRTGWGVPGLIVVVVVVVSAGPV